MFLKCLRTHICTVIFKLLLRWKWKKNNNFHLIRNQSDSDSLWSKQYFCVHTCAVVFQLFLLLQYFTSFHIQPTMVISSLHHLVLKKYVRCCLTYAKSSDKGNKMPKGKRWLIYWTSIANSSKTNITHFYHRLSEVLGLSIQWAKIFNSMKNSTKNKYIFLKGDYVEI